MNDPQKVTDIMSLLNSVPSWVYAVACYIVLKNFTTIGAILQKFVDYKILTNDVSELKESVRVLKKDMDACHDKIRDLERGGKITDG